MKRLRTLSLVLVCLLAAGCASQVAQPPFHVSFDTVGELQAYLAWSPERVPLVAAHRGGPETGYPENCLATFENALSYAPCLIECDVRATRDSVLVMMHDDTLERTTTGTGNVADHTLAELRALKLVDDEGEVTPYGIPTLAEALRWAKGRAIVELDVKRPVMPEAVVSVIEENEAESCAVVITYNTPTALRYHKLNPDLVISASARDMEGARRLLDSGIDPANLLAFVGVYEPPDSLYAYLHAHGVRAILGTMGNLDRRAERRGAHIYRELVDNGADILATDRVDLAAEGIGGRAD